ncbi:MAG: ABC transporter permease [Cyclobacteriaceae bacterium]
MWKNFFVITYRNLTRHSFYSFINIFGLAIGLTAGFLILQHVYYQLSYDNFFDNKENIYRVQTNRLKDAEMATQWAAGCAGVGLHMKEDFPEVLDFVNMHVSGAEISYNQKYFTPEYPYYAAASFFKVFSVPLLRGVDSLVLKEPFTVALSETMANKMFGDEDPMGKVIQMNDDDDFKVTGIFQDIPENSHMSFDVLYSFETYVAFTSENARTAWQWDGFLNYVVLHPGTDPQQLSQKFPEFVQQRQGEELEQYGAGMEFVLQPLNKIHLTSNYRSEIKTTGDERATYFLLVIGMFVLFIAWINYINLTTARSLSRAREVGIRKVMGSFKAQLVRQFMFESLFINLLAFLISVILVLIIFPFFNDFAGRNSSYPWPDSSVFWLGLATIFGTGILLSGFYPALVLSKFKPVTVLKGKFSGSSSGNLLRKGLVTFQFLASLVLITGTYVVYKQMNFLQSQDLGVNINQTLVIETPNFQSDSVFSTKDNVFRNRLIGESFVNNMTTSTAVPGETPQWNAGGIRLLSQTEAESNQYRVLGGDAGFMDFYGLEMVSGRGFDESFGTEESSVIFNEEAMKLLGFNDVEEILNQKINFWGDTFNIVGVVKNYRQESPKEAYDALIFRYFNSPSGYYSVNLNGNLRQSVDQVKTHYEAAFGTKTFNFFFLDDHYNQQYQAELKFGNIFGLFSGLAIIVACLGLFGLASYITSLRAKEVGVRKVLGASIQNLWMLLTSDFLKLVGLSVLVAVPISYFVMQNWLENFANRINLGVMIFLLPVVILILIAVATVSYHTIRTSNLNPAETLKDE